MTIRFFLVRHAAHDHVGKYLAGRKPGVTLGDAGLAQAHRLGTRLRAERFTRIFSSPRERARQTAAAIAAACGGEVDVDDALDEIDFGRWSGQSFEQLALDPDWQRWNEDRETARTPAGESMLDVQHRVCACMASIEERFASATVALVSHADIIKSAICEVLGLPLGRWDRFDVAPASISVIVRSGAWANVACLNEVTP